MKKKYISAAMSMMLAMSMMVGCNGNTNTTNTTETTVSAESTNVAEEGNYVYGTARLTWAQFWSEEAIDYDTSRAFDATNEITDTEGVTDLGGFDAVTRATSKHGVYRGSANYSSLLHAVDEAGNEVAVYLEDMTDAANVEDMYGVEKNFYGLADGTYCIAQPEGESTIYTITGVEIVGYKAWPVKVLESEVEAAAEAVNFQADENVTEETSLLKTVSVVDGNVTVSAAAEDNGLAVNYTGTPSVSYNDKYGDYVFVQLSDCEAEWGMNLLGAVYSYYGDVNPEENAGAEPVATYGTKYASDTWWKSNGKLLQFGINTSYRHGAEEQYGYWQITVMSAGYENYTFTVQALPAYEAEVTATLGEDNKTLTIAGIADADWANTAVAVDDVVIEGIEGGVAVLEELVTGAHTVAINIDGYREITAEVVAMSAVKAEDITLVGNVLNINGGDLDNFLSNVTGIAVGETTLSGSDLGHVVFNADGSINFTAEISGRGGNTVVFPNGSKESYMLIITSAGYPNVILTTEVAN